MKTVTFYSNTRYAGGRSHRNINTLEFVEDKDIFEAAEHYGYNLYPAQGEDFDNGVHDWNGNEVMDAEDYEKYNKTGVGRIDLGDTVFYSCELEEIDVDGFKVLPASLQLEYVNLFYADVTAEMLEYANKIYSPADSFEFDEKSWQAVREALEEEVEND